MTPFADVYENHEFNLTFGPAASDPLHLLDRETPNFSWDPRPTQVPVPLTPGP